MEQKKVKIIGGRRAGKTISALEQFYEYGKKGSSIILRSPAGDFVTPSYLEVLLNQTQNNLIEKISNWIHEKSLRERGLRVQEIQEFLASLKKGK